jgi:hypothetical protein
MVIGFPQIRAKRRKWLSKAKKKMMMTAVYGMQQCGVPRRLDDDHNAFADSHVRNQHSGVLVGFEKTGIRRPRLTANI